MSVVEDCGSLETGDVVVFLKQLSDSERQTLMETVQQCWENDGGTVLDPDFGDLYGMKESEGNERTKESEDLEICCASMTSNSPGAMDTQTFAEDQSLFFDVPQKDLAPLTESHSHQFLQGLDTGSEFGNSQTLSTIFDPSQAAYLSSELYELYLRETFVVDDWGSNSGQGFDAEPRGLAESPQSCPTSGSSLLMVASDSGSALTKSPKGFVASQRSKFDSCQLSSHPSATTVPKQEVVKTECNEEWSASEGNEGVYDAKKERRRQQNRTAARRCRNRKKETFESMSKTLKKTKLENELLQKAVVHLREKLRSVTELVRLHQTHCNLQLVTSQFRSPVSASNS